MGDEVKVTDKLNGDYMRFVSFVFIRMPRRSVAKTGGYKKMETAGVHWKHSKLLNL
jgi:hypothetical protein